MELIADDVADFVTPKFMNSEHICPLVDYTFFMLKFCLTAGKVLLTDLSVVFCQFNLIYV